jgi:phosphohistidine phosphatase
MWPNVSAMSDQRRTLVLLRHAKSAYPFGVGDHERPLAPRGRREAGLAGEWLRSGTVDPIQGVLCSTATRTRQTLMETGIGAPVQFSERLYCATPRAVIDEINQVRDAFTADVRSLLVIAHEPGMSQLALALTGAEGSNETAAANVATKFPTSAIAVLRFDGPWQRLEPGEAALVTFHVPR